MAYVAASLTDSHSTLFQGTFWYHSHFRNQYCDGLRGALIIYDPEDPHQALYDVDDGEGVLLSTTDSSADTFLEMIPSSHWQIGTITFLLLHLRSRELPCQIFF